MIRRQRTSKTCEKSKLDMHIPVLNNANDKIKSAPVLTSAMALGSYFSVFSARKHPARPLKTNERFKSNLKNALLASYFKQSSKEPEKPAFSTNSIKIALIDRLIQILSCLLNTKDCIHKILFF